MANPSDFHKPDPPGYDVEDFLGRKHARGVSAGEAAKIIGSYGKVIERNVEKRGWHKPRASNLAALRTSTPDPISRDPITGKLKLG